MSNDNAFRELKFSPGQLVIVFVAILVLGVFVFLLGISVGKKQTVIRAQAGPAGVELAKAQEPAPPIKVGEYVTTTAPAEAKADPNAARAGEGAKTEKAAEKPETKEKPAEAKPPEEKPAGTKAPETKPAPKPDQPKSKAETAAAPAYKSAPYYIQIGAVEGRAAAETYAKKVSGLGFPTLVLDPFATDKKPVYRVRVGPYPSKNEASDAQGELATALKKKKTDFFLVKS